MCIGIRNDLLINDVVNIFLLSFRPTANKYYIHWIMGSAATRLTRFVIFIPRV